MSVVAAYRMFVCVLFVVHGGMWTGYSQLFVVQGGMWTGYSQLFVVQGGM